MKLITPTALRENVYKVLDSIITTGVPQHVQRKGHVLTITIAKKVDKLANLEPHDTVVGDPDELINFPTSEWTEEKNL